MPHLQNYHQTGIDTLYFVNPFIQPEFIFTVFTELHTNGSVYSGLIGCSDECD